MYDLIAPFYDEANGELDYGAWADFFERLIKRYMKDFRPELILDLGCGTGRMTLELAARGYDMTGVDNSPEMLNEARAAAEARGLDKSILFLCQDMTDFELYGTVDVTVSCLDCINHLTTPQQLCDCFALVHNYLIPDGLFLFDINGRHKFETVYATQTYTVESEDSFCIWENCYDEKSRLCDFYITLFKECEDGRYERFEDTQTERMYTLRSIKKHLSDAGFEWLGAFADFDGRDATDADDRIYIVARCKKPTQPTGEENDDTEK